MAYKSKIHVTGSTRTSSVRMEWHGDEIKGKLRAAQMQGIGFGVDRMRDAAKARCPVKEGTLRDSIEARMSAQGKVEGYVFAGGKDAPHAHLVEFGTVKTPPTPFFRNTFDMNVNRVKKGIGDQITEVMK